MLNSAIPMYLFWGKEHTCFCNDAYLEGPHIDGAPIAIGQKGEMAWSTMWEEIQPFIKSVRESGEPVSKEDFLLRANDDPKNMLWTFNFSAVKGTAGDIAGVLVICTGHTGNHATRNIKTTIRNRIPEASENRFRILVETSPIPMCLFTGADMKIQLINEALPSVWQKDKSIIGKPLVEVLPGMKDQPYLNYLHKVYTTGESISIKDAESTLYHEAKSHTVYFDLWFKPVMNEETGKLFGILVSGVDVTEKVLSKRQTQKSEMLFRMMVEYSTVAVGLTRGEDMVFETINTPMMELIGRMQHIIGRPLLHVIPELKDQPISETLKNVFHSGNNYTGTEVPVTLLIEGLPVERFYDISYIRFSDNEGVHYILHIVIDVTKQKLARRKLEEVDAKSKVAIQSADLGTYELNLVTEELKASKRFTAIWGADYREVSRREFIEYIHPDDRALRRNAHKEALVSGKLFYEARIVWRDETIHWIRVVGTVIFDQAKKAVALIGVIKDITEQKIIQQRKDNFIAMASHELKTPLTSLKGYAYILRDMLSKRTAGPETEVLDRLDNQLNSLSRLVSDLSTISRIDRGKFDHDKSHFDLDELLTYVADDLQGTVAQHRFRLNLGGPAEVNADKDRIVQVVINFISNAVKYSPGATAVSISSQVSSNEAIVCIEDYGIGIPLDELEYIFVQFYRVNNEFHQSFPGMGLGLYICATIISNEGGKIWVESTEGKGSKFYFSLPLAKDKG